MKQTILIRDVQLVQGGISPRCDMLIQDGVIAKLGKDLNESAHFVIDGSRLTALPGLFDMHVHLRDPGQTHKEDIFTGSAAALAGGITGVACMPNTSPAIDSVDTVRYICEKAAYTGVEIHPVGCITKGLKGEEMCDYAALKDAGICAISDDGRPVECAETMRQALIQGDALGLPVISHCEDLSIINGGIVNRGVASETLGVRGMDRASEDYITAREIILAASANVPIHIAHVSTYGSVEIIRHAKAQGVKVTCETCPHYFLMTEEAVLCGDADYRMNPPLRTERDRQAIIEGLKNGSIDMIATDHAPHSAEEKAKPLTQAPSGIIGLETALGLAVTNLVRPGHLSLLELMEKMSLNPAKLYHLDSGSVEEGKAADLVLFDPEEEWTVGEFASKSSNSPFTGSRLYGKVKYTICGGKIVYRDGE